MLVRLPSASLPQKEAPEEASEERILDRVIDRPVPGLDPFAQTAYRIDPAEQPVRKADRLAFHVFAEPLAKQKFSDAPVEQGRHKRPNFALEVAKEDETRPVGQVLGGVEGFVEKDSLLIPPEGGNPVHDNFAIR